MTLDSLPDLDTSGLCLVKTLSTALTCWPSRNTRHGSLRSDGDARFEEESPKTAVSVGFGCWVRRAGSAHLLGEICLSLPPKSYVRPSEGPLRATHYRRRPSDPSPRPRGDIVHYQSRWKDPAIPWEGGTNEDSLVRQNLGEGSRANGDAWKVEPWPQPS